MAANVPSIPSLALCEDDHPAVASAALKTTAQIYQSAPLPLDGSRTIRLIEVLLSDDAQDATAPIRCRLHLTSLHSPEPYTALSYVWGDSNETETIELDGQPFVVRRNLWAFLRQLQEFHEAARSGADEERSMLLPPRLWIDAICIDQSSNKERGHQVAMMGSIYSQATWVLAWLGPSTPGTTIAMDFLASDNQHWVSIEEALLVLQSLAELLRRNYWSRMWIVQEFILAKDVHLWCGGQGLRLRSTRIQWLVDKAYGRIYENWGHAYLRYLGAVVDIESPAWNLLAQRYLMPKSDQDPKLAQPGLVELLRKYRHLGCEDPRDKVYALLSLLSPQERAHFAIGPDYKIPPRELFLQLTRKSHVDLWFLGRAMKLRMERRSDGRTDRV